MNDSYAATVAAVTAALASVDPMRLADPELDLREEYGSESGEIARRLLGSGAGASSDAVRHIRAVLEESFGEAVSPGVAARIQALVVKSLE